MVHPNFTGYWVQDKKRSDKDDESFALIEAGFLLRQGAGAVRGVEIWVTDEHLEFDVVTIVPFFKIKEKYPFSGEVIEQKRRDMRSGAHKGSVAWISGGQQIQVSFTFEGELGGKGNDVYKLVNDDEMHITHTLENAKGKVSSTKIYTRKK